MTEVKKKDDSILMTQGSKISTLHAYGEYYLISGGSVWKRVDAKETDMVLKEVGYVKKHGGTYPKTAKLSLSTGKTLLYILGYFLFLFLIGFFLLSLTY